MPTHCVPATEPTGRPIARDIRDTIGRMPLHEPPGRQDRRAESHFWTSPSLRNDEMDPTLTLEQREFARRYAAWCARTRR